MPRFARRTTASLIATAAVAAAAAAAPVPEAPAMRDLIEPLLVLRDGHGARHLPQPDAMTRSTP